MKLPLILALSLGLASPFSRGQDNPLNDPDLQKMLKEAQDLQKNSTPAKMSDLKKKAAEMMAEAKQEEARQAAKEKAALQKQFETSGPPALPAWAPATPQFTVTGALSKKIEDERVRFIQTGTSPLSPKELGDAWDAAVPSKEINRGRNNSNINGAIGVSMYFTTQTDPPEELRLEAKRGPEGKVTKISIALVLPKPETDDSE